MKYSISDLVLAKKNGNNSREELMRCTLCGCYNCLRVFLVNDIRDYKDDGNSYLSNIGLCPYCHSEHIIGESSCYPLKYDFLEAMKKYHSVSD